MDIENTVNKIIETTGMSKSELKEKVEQRRKELSNLIDEEGAITLIAKDLGINLKDYQEKSKTMEDTPINICKEKSEVSVVGRITRIQEIKTFNRKEGDEGKLLPFSIRDSSGSIRCVAWDSNTDILNQPEFKEGAIIRVVNGFVKKGYYGDLEINIGSKSRIQTNPDEVDMKNIPTNVESESDVIKIEELLEKGGFANIIGLISDIEEPRLVTLRDQTQKEVQSMIVADDTGSIKLTLWGEQTKLGFKKGDTVEITSINAKLNSYSDKMEATITRNGKIEASQKKISGVQSSETISTNRGGSSGSENKSIKDLIDQGGFADIVCKITDIEEVRTITLKDQSQKELQSMIVSDNTGSIKFTVWGEQTNHGFKKGDSIEIIGVGAKLNSYSSQMEANLTRNGSINPSTKKIQVISSSDSISLSRGEPAKSEKKSIQEVIDQGGFADIIGKITDLEDARTITLKNQEEKEIQSLIVSDSTGSIKITLWGDQTKNDYQVDDVLEFTGIFAKTNSYSNQIEGSISRNGNISKSGQEIQVIDNPKTLNAKKAQGSSDYLNELYDTSKRISIEQINSDNFVTFKGTLIKDIRRIYIYEACTKCNKKIENCSCPGTNESVFKMILNVTLDDGTKTIRATMFGEQAEQFLDIETINIKKTQDNNEFDEFLNKINLRLVGREYIFRGKAKYSDYSENYEVNITSFSELEVNKETDRILQLIEEKSL